MRQHGAPVAQDLVVGDPALATLPAVLDGASLSAHLREHLPQEGAGSKDLSIKILRHHAGKRCVLEVTWRDNGTARGLIAKVYAKDRSDVYRVMDHIWRAGLGPEERFSIPRPIAYVDALQLLLQERVEGRPATDSILSDDEVERMTAAERCAGWLASFHAAAARTGSRVDLDARLRSREQWVRRLAALGGPIGDKTFQLQGRLEAAAAALPAADACTIHGDYSHHQVLFADGRTVAVDWDKHRLADPGEDVARFIVGLQRLAQKRRGSMRALDGTADVFLEAYLASAAADCEGRVAFHRAAVCLEHAKHDAHKQSPEWPGRAIAALDEGLRVLGQGS